MVFNSENPLLLICQWFEKETFSKKKFRILWEERLADD